MKSTPSPHETPAPVPMPGRRPRVVFAGMRCPFSRPPLEALVAAGWELPAVLLPAPPGAPPVTRLPLPARSVTNSLPIAGGGESANHLGEVAARAGATLYAVGDLRSEAVADLLRTIAPDVVAVACFPKLVPASLLAIPAHGWVNVHPSLLPRWRGREPLFWTFQAGESTCGVTVHQMDAAFDHGPVLAREARDLAAGERLETVEEDLARRGGTLLVRSLAALLEGSARPEPQPTSGGTEAPTPDPAALEIGAGWSAERAFRFAAGVGEHWGPLVARGDDGAPVAVIGATNWGQGQDGPSQPQPGCAVLRFGDGWVECTLAERGAGQGG